MTTIPLGSQIDSTGFQVGGINSKVAVFQGTANGSVIVPNPTAVSTNWFSFPCGASLTLTLPSLSNNDATTTNVNASYLTGKVTHIIVDVIPTSAGNSHSFGTPAGFTLEWNTNGTPPTPNNNAGKMNRYAFTLSGGDTVWRGTQIFVSP